MFSGLFAVGNREKSIYYCPTCGKTDDAIRVVQGIFLFFFNICIGAWSFKVICQELMAMSIKSKLGITDLD